MTFHNQDLPDHKSQQLFPEWVLGLQGKTPLNKIDNGFGWKIPIDVMIIAIHHAKTSETCSPTETQERHHVPQFIPCVINSGTFFKNCRGRLLHGHQLALFKKRATHNFHCLKLHLQYCDVQLPCAKLFLS